MLSQYKNQLEFIIFNMINTGFPKYIGFVRHSVKMAFISDERDEIKRQTVIKFPS